MNTNLKSYLAHTVQRPAVREHLPFDMAIKKYHDNIGSRLSEMAVPEQYSTDHDERLSKDFCMLTIDNRRLRSLRQKENAPHVTMTNRIENSSDDSGLELSTATSPYTASSRSVTSFSAGEQENCPRGKRHLFDKLTCSLFLRKHMCARCKRRSRSCVAKKTFCGSEKRYMCCRCRGTSQTIKNIFDGHSNSKDSSVPHSCQGQPLPFVSNSKKRNAHIPRKNVKDSGYDTVTSCSTVASAVSAFSTPANVRQNINKDKSSIKPVLFGDFGFNSDRGTNRFTHNNPGCKYEQDLHVLGVYSEPDISSEATVDSESEFSNFQIDDQHESTEDELIQVKQRKAQRHDGYIPKTDINSWDQKKLRPVLSDSSNLDDASENGDYCYYPPRIIRVSQTGKNTTSQKACYTCDSISKPCFRLPWEGGWVCEDCLDGLH